MTDESTRLIHNAIVLICCTGLSIAFSNAWFMWLTPVFWSVR